MSSSQPYASGSDRPDFGPYDQITYIFDDTGADTAIQPSEYLTFTPLGRAVYNLLRLRVPGSRDVALISYGQLCSQLPARFADVVEDDSRLMAALEEVVVTCRKMALPALSAIVVHEKEQIPSDGYFQVAHPNEASDPVARINAWHEELDRVLKTTFRELN